MPSNHKRHENNCDIIESYYESKYIFDGNNMGAMDNFSRQNQIQSGDQF